MGKGFGIHPALNSFLDPVVANRRRRFHCLGDLTRIESQILPRFELPHKNGRCPDPGEAVGLELQPDGEFVGLTRILLLQLLDLFHGSQHVLDMVTDLVGEDVGGCQVAGSSESGPKLFEELHVKVDARVERAVVGTHPGIGSTTPGFGESREKDEFGWLILTSGLGEDIGPERLVVVQDHRHEIGHLGLGIGGWIERVGLGGSSGDRLQLVEDVLQTAATPATPASEEGKENGDDDGNSASSGPNRHATGTTAGSPPAVDDVTRPLGRLTESDHFAMVPS